MMMCVICEADGKEEEAPYVLAGYSVCISHYTRVLLDVRSVKDNSVNMNSMAGNVILGEVIMLHAHNVGSGPVGG